MKRIFALLLAVLLCVGLFAACKKTPGAKPGTTTQAGETIIPQGSTLPGAAAAPGEHGDPGDTEIDDATEPPGQKSYSSPKRIPTVREGKDYTNGGIPDGVAEIYAVDGRLLFTYVTRWVGDAETRTNRDFYTLFEYTPENGKCHAVSPEVGYILRVGDRFLYDKVGVGIGAENYWDVPYFTNNGSWTDEQPITGAEARRLISAPAQALIQGKMQPYAIQRSGTALAVSLPESGEVLALTLDVKGMFGKTTPDGLLIDIRGAANEKIYLSVGCVLPEGGYIKELYVMPIAGGKPSPIRYNDLPIWVDPISGIDNEVVYGYSIQPNKTRALLRLDTATDTVQLLATVRDAVWHCVATDEYVLYEIPKKAGQDALACKKIG